MDTDNDFLPSKAFDIFEDIGSYDPKESPSNGYEYLYQVIYESSKAPQTLVASIDTEKYKKNQTFYIQENKTETIDKGFLPTDEWQVKQLQHFKVVRNLIVDMRQNWKKRKLSGNDTSVNSVPEDLGKEDEWLKFCSETQPLLSILFSINQTGLDQLLNYFSMWLQENLMEFSHKTSMWLFSILACLEEPLPPNICANIRSIIRYAKQRRNSLKSTSDEVLVPLNVIICIAVKYFRQTDLGD